jgi:hypothetical protein
MGEVSRHLFIPRLPLMASMWASDPERNWFRITKASLISSTRRKEIAYILEVVRGRFSFEKKKVMELKRSSGGIIVPTLLAPRQFVGNRHAIGNVRRVRRLGFGHQLGHLRKPRPSRPTRRMKGVVLEPGGCVVRASLGFARDARRQRWCHWRYGRVRDVPGPL